MFVIGDAAYLVDSKTGKAGAGRVAGRAADGAVRGAGDHARRLGRAAGVPRAQRGFHYRDLGSMATVGKSRAVVEIGPFRFGGFLAWMAWLALHITVLIGFRNRISVLVSWIYGYVFFRRGSRLITRMPRRATSQEPHARPGYRAAGPKQ